MLKGVTIRLLLVRHGETEENAAGIVQGHLPGKLTERGRRQAELLAARLAAESIDALYTSDLARAAHTAAAIVRAAPKLHLQTDAALRERALGVYEGRHGQHYYDDFQASGRPRWEFKPAGGESIREVQARSDAFLKRVIPRHPGQSVLFCTHGGIITTLLATLVDASLEEMLVHRFRNTSLTVVEVQNGLVRVPMFNSVDHLEEPGSGGSADT